MATTWSAAAAAQAGRAALQVALQGLAPQGRRPLACVSCDERKRRPQTTHIPAAGLGFRRANACLFNTGAGFYIPGSDLLKWHRWVLRRSPYLSACVNSSS
jgi:hypothetical protein